MPGAGAAELSEQEARGAYVFRAANCQSCHTDVKNKGPLLAGGRALATPFGTFYGPNITPDPEHGIGGWSDDDFIAALRHGRAPDGRHYFPAFPYTAFTGMNDEDMRALKAYIFTLPASDRANRPHELGFPFGWRFLAGIWKWLNFEPGPFEPDPGRSEALNRGAYLVEALGHCAECHTPRGVTGALDAEMAYAGSGQGPEGGRVPNITPDKETGIGGWNDGRLTFFFRFGLTADGDAVGGLMAEVVENSTSQLTDEDLKAVIAYLRSLTPIRNRIARPPKGQEG
jgi:mono/diheme cytochrome c family protein